MKLLIHKYIRLIVDNILLFCYVGVGNILYRVQLIFMAKKLLNIQIMGPVLDNDP